MKHWTLKNFHLIFMLVCLNGCKSKLDILYQNLSRDDRKIDKYEGHYKLSQLNAKKSDIEIGIASWYGKKTTNNKKKKIPYNKQTANGDIFDCNMLTAAHRTLPMPSIARVTHLESNKSIIVMINDRGPYSKNRILDVSRKVAEYLNFKKKGIAKVKIEPLEKESQELLTKLSLRPKSGSKPQGKIKDPNCSINCFVKILNIREGRKDL